MSIEQTMILAGVAMESLSNRNCLRLHKTENGDHLHTCIIICHCASICDLTETLSLREALEYIITQTGKIDWHSWIIGAFVKNILIHSIEQNAC